MIVEAANNLRTPGLAEQLFACNRPAKKAAHKREYPRGDGAYNAKLTEADVAAARRAYARAQEAISRINATYSIAALAVRYGVATRTMQMALSGETWGHVQKTPPMRPLPRRLISHSKAAPAKPKGGGRKRLGESEAAAVMALMNERDAARREITKVYGLEAIADRFGVAPRTISKALARMRRDLNDQDQSCLAGGGV